MKKLMHVSLMLVAALVFACGGDSTPDTDVVGDTPIGDQGDTKTDSVDTPDTPDDKEEPETKEDLVDNGDTETTPEGECSPATVDTDCAELCTDLDPCQECLCNVTIGGGTCEITNKENGASCDSGHECSINNTCEDGVCGGGRRSANVVKRLTARSTKTATSVMAHWFAIKANSLTSVKLMTKELWSVTTPKIRLVASVAASLRPGIVS